MQLLVLSTWHPYPPDNGSKLRAYYLLRELARHHSVTLLSFDPKERSGDPPGDTGVGVRTVLEDPFRHTHAPKLVRYLSPIPLAYWPSRRMKQALAALSTTHWDAVIALQMPVAQYALQAKASARLVDVDTSLSYWALDDLRAAQSLPARTHRWVSWQKGYRYEQRVSAKFDVATVVSPLEVAYLEQMLAGSPAQVRVAPNGVDCDHNHPGLADSLPCRLVYNGSLTYSANYDAVRWFLAEVYPRIKEHRPDVSLAVTGSTKGVDTAAFALDPSVTLTGYVEDVRIPVAEAAACVVPIRQGGGTRLKILEAMALGTPVIVTRKGAEGLDVVDSEHLLLADNAEDFARCTVELLGNADLRSLLAANARQLVEERYDWSTIGARFVSLVEGAVGRHA